jgi:hypothetical protein
MRFRISSGSFPLTGRRQKCYLEETVSPGTPNTAFRRQPVALTHLTDILLTNTQLLPDLRGLCLPLVAFRTVRSPCSRFIVGLTCRRDRVAAPNPFDQVRLRQRFIVQFMHLTQRSGVSPTAPCALLARRSARLALVPLSGVHVSVRSVLLHLSN